MQFGTIRASCEPSTIVPGAATGIHGHAQSVDSGDPGFQGPTTRDSGAWILPHSDYSIAVQSDNIRARTHEIMNRRGRAAQRSKRSSALRTAKSTRHLMRMDTKHNYRTSPLNLSHFGCALVRDFRTSARAKRKNCTNLLFWYLQKGVHWFDPKICSISGTYGF